MLLLSLSLSRGVFATEPCSSDSWFSNQKRNPAQWALRASWIATAKVVERKDRSEPYVNCYSQDRSKCAMEDVSEVRVKILKVEKGKTDNAFILMPSYCAPPPPKMTGKPIRIYGSDPHTYLFFESIRDGK